MSQGVNKVTLLGNLGADPEVRYMPSGDAVANLSIATSNSWKDRETGEWQEHTEWHRVVVKKHLAERTPDSKFPRQDLLIPKVWCRTDPYSLIFGHIKVSHFLNVFQRFL